MAEDWTGRVVDGRYVVEATLGAGGMGVVLRARHQFTGAYVALKMLRQHLVTNADVQARFLGEARVPSSIGHRGIVQVLDAGRTPEGELYLAMELLDGVSLRDVVRGGLSGAEIKRVLIELLDALGAAHARGVVHRDLKPENVFLSGPAKVVKLLDFGIAKIVQSDASGLGRTSAGDLLGTLAYMAPEQIRDASAVDPRADLWAVGVMVYEMLAGRLPYKPTDLHGLFVAISTRDPDPIGEYVPNVPPAVTTFFARALAREPQQRFLTARDLAAAIAQLPLEQLVPRAGIVGGAHGSVVSGVAATAAGAQSQWAHGTSAPPQGSQVGQSGQPYAHASPHGSQVGQSGQPYAQSGQPYAQSGQPYAQSGQPYSQHQQASVQAPAPPAPPAMTTSHAPRSMWPLALLGVAVIAGIVIIVVVLSGKHDGPTTVTNVVTPGSGSAGSAAHDDWDIHAKVDVPPVDAPDEPRKPPPPPPPPKKAVSPVQACIAKCGELTMCGFQTQQCTALCNASAPLASCFAKVAVDSNACNSAVSCMFQASCGVVPRGTWSCNQTAQCQGACNGNAACGCQCIGNMDKSHALVLAALDVCAGNCGFDNNCILQNCGTPLQLCMMQ